VKLIIPDGGDPSIVARFGDSQTFPVPLYGSTNLRFASLLFFSQYLSPQWLFRSGLDILQMEVPIALPLSKIRRLADLPNIVFDMHSIMSIDLQPYLPTTAYVLIKPILDAAQGFLCRNAHCTVVSNSMKKYVLQRWDVDPDRIHVITNGVDTDLAGHAMVEFADHFDYLREGADPLLVYVGGLEWYEGVDIAIRALPTLKRTLPNIRLVIAGRGTEESHLRSITSHLGLDTTVRFEGWVPYEETFALQSAADILIAPRKPLQSAGIDISTPMKIPSYLTAGRPIVASSVGEIPYVARHSEEAYLIPHSDIRSFIDAVLTVWGDESLCERLSKNAKKRAEHYSWKRISLELVSLYNEILNAS